MEDYSFSFKFSLRNISGQLTSGFSPVHAEDVSNSHSIDPFVRIFNNDEALVGQSRVIRKVFPSEDPRWTGVQVPVNRLTFALPEMEANPLKVIFEVYNYRLLQKDELIGSVCLELQDLFRIELTKKTKSFVLDDQEKENWVFTLEDVEFVNNSAVLESTQKIDLDKKFPDAKTEKLLQKMNDEEEFQVLLKLSGIELIKTDFVGKMNPYFKVFTLEKKRKLIYKSEVISKNANPNWKMFVLRQPDFAPGWKFKQIIVMVYASNILGMSELIGRVEFNSTVLLAAAIQKVSVTWRLFRPSRLNKDVLKMKGKLKLEWSFFNHDISANQLDPDDAFLDETLFFDQTSEFFSAELEETDDLDSVQPDSVSSRDAETDFDDSTDASASSINSDASQVEDHGIEPPAVLESCSSLNSSFVNIDEELDSIPSREQIEENLEENVNLALRKVSEIKTPSNRKISRVCETPSFKFIPEVTESPNCEPDEKVKEKSRKISRFFGELRKTSKVSFDLPEEDESYIWTPEFSSSIHSQGSQLSGPTEDESDYVSEKKTSDSVFENSHNLDEVPEKKKSLEASLDSQPNLDSASNVAETTDEQRQEFAIGCDERNPKTSGTYDPDVDSGKTRLDIDRTESLEKAKLDDNESANLPETGSFEGVNQHQTMGQKRSRGESINHEFLASCYTSQKLAFPDQENDCLKPEEIYPESDHSDLHGRLADRDKLGSLENQLENGQNSNSSMKYLILSAVILLTAIFYYQLTKT